MGNCHDICSIADGIGTNTIEEEDSAPAEEYISHETASTNLGSLLANIKLDS